jgi:type II secretory pathway component PulK
MAVLLVLWGTLLVSVLVTALARSTALEAHRFANMMHAASARAALDSGFAAGIVGLLTTDPNAKWRADGTPVEFTIDGAVFQVAINAESGRIDLNTTRADLVRRFLQAQVGATLTAQIVGQGRTVLAQNRPGSRSLLSVMELAGVPDMDAASYAAIAGGATVHNRGGLVDWHTANPTVLALFPDMNPKALARLMAHRQDNNYTPDDELAHILGATAGPSSDTDQTYTMHLSVRMPNNAEASAVAVFSLTPSGTAPFQIWEWRSPAMDGPS